MRRLTDSQAPKEEQSLPWSERIWRRNVREYMQSDSPQFRAAQKAFNYGSVTFVAFFVLLSVITALFGKPA